jgi:hypothetical protein
VSQFLLSINSTPSPSINAPTTLTITPAELTAAAGLTLNFATATQAQLLAAVDSINPGAPLITPTEAEDELSNTVYGTLSGSYQGSYSGSISGNFNLTISSTGTVSGSATSPGGNEPVAGNLVSGTVYSGTTGVATWTGTVNTSVTPITFSGTWVDTVDSLSGTFTGTKQ